MRFSKLAILFLLLVPLVVLAKDYSDAALRRAALEVLERDCPAYDSMDEFLKQQKILNDAGPKALPVLAEMISGRTTTDLFLINAALFATRQPLSEPMRDALRSRRADPEIASNRSVLKILLIYFAQFGDQSDLAWMETVKEKADPADQPEVAHFIKELNTRLAAQGQPAP